MKNAIRLVRYLSLAALALAPAAVFADDVACMNVELGVGASQVCAGDSVDVSGSLANCGTGRDRPILYVAVVAPGMGGGYKLAFGNVRAGASTSFDIPFPVPADSPLGTYTVTVTATSNHGAPDDVASASFEVIGCSGEPGP